MAGWTRLRFAAISLFILSISFSAFAQSTPDIPADQNSAADKATVERMAKFYQPVAVAFRSPKFAWGSFLKDHAQIQLEYVPDGDNVARWTRLLTINLYPLPQDASAQIDVMKKIEGSLLSNYQGHGKIIEQNLYENSQGLPRLYIEYEIGEDIQREHAAGALLILAANVASFIQVQARGRPFEPNDAANMKLLAEGKLKLAPPS
jgi:hypothetical protein